MTNDTNSRDRNNLALKQAKTSIVGGANSTMRVLPYQLPLFVKSAGGAKIWDGGNRREY